MTGRLDDLFAAARSSALAEVRPPGVAAARRTVRRRRIGTSVAAAVALVLVATVAAVVTRAGDDPVPAAAASDLSAWSNNVTLAVGVDHQQGPAEVLTMTGAGERRSAESTFGGGTYQVTAACAGQGVVTLTFDLGSASGPAIPLACSTPAGPVHTSVTVPESATTIQVVATPDATAAGWSAVAFQLRLSDHDRDRLLATAMAGLPGDPSAPVSAGLLPTVFGASDTKARAGTYRAWLSCYGTGTVRLTVDLTVAHGAAQRLGQAELTCGPATPSGSVRFTVPEKAGALDATLTPDRSSTGAAAFRLERL